MEKRLFALGLVMAGAVLAALAFPLLQGRLYLKDDLGIYHLALRSFYARSLADGQSFLWHPGLFCGYYVHGEGQAGMLHPLHLLLYGTLPLEAAFHLELWLNYPFLLAGTFLFLRRWRLRRDAAVFGALVFSFSSFNFLHVIHPNMVAVAAHVPWLLLVIEEILHGSQPRRVVRAGACLGLLSASQLLLGHPQAVWLSLVLEVAYVLFRLAGVSQRGRRLAWLGASLLLGWLGGAVQLLPTWEVAAGSVRATASFASGYREIGSMQPANLLQLVAPYLLTGRVIGIPFPAELALYAGALASVLPLWLWIRRRELGAGLLLARGALALGVLALLLAAGKYGYVYRLQGYLPMVGGFGVPGRYLLLFDFALALAAALAFADLARVAERGVALPWRRLWPLFAPLAASTLVAAAALWLRAHPESLPELVGQLAPPTRALAGPLLLALATALLVAAARGSRSALAGMLVFGAADLGAYGLSFVRDPAPVSLADAVQGQALPPEPVAYRVQSYNNYLTLRGISLAGGYAALRPRWQLAELDPVRLRLAGVEWVQTRTPWGGGPSLSAPADGFSSEELWFTRDALGQVSSWSRVPEPLARARLVARVQVSRDPGADLGGIDPATTALVPEPLALGSGAPGSVAVVRDLPGRVRLRTTAPSRQLLVLSERWDAGWRVSTGGEPQQLVRVYGDFMGVVVEPGRHEVEFRFEPRSLRLGAALSALGVGPLLLCWLGSLRRGRVER